MMTPWKLRSVLLLTVLSFYPNDSVFAYDYRISPDGMALTSQDSFRVESALSVVESIYPEENVSDIFTINISEGKLELVSEKLNVVISRATNSILRIGFRQNSISRGDKVGLRKLARNTAVSQAQSILAEILGEKAGEFDSITVFQPSSGYTYEIYFTTKDTGFIADDRSARLFLDAETGQVQQYYGHTDNPFPPDYQPQISKPQAENAIHSYARERAFLLRIHYLKVRMGGFCVEGKIPVWQAFVEVGIEDTGETKWHWSPCTDCFRYGICINAETGEVTGANLPPKLKE